MADAANAATRAQRELEETKEEFRKKTSRQFSEEMKEIRKTARELAETQKEISEKLENGEKGQRNPGDPFNQPNPLENMKLSQELDAQRDRLENLLEDMKQLSEESEVSEPLLSESLYEAVRNSMVNGVGESLEEARDYTRYNRRDQARTPEQAAARGIEELKEGVEAAAEKILGSEADSLRLARSELDKLIEQAKDESERLGGEGKEKGEEGEEMELAMNDTDQKSEAGSQGSEGEHGETQQGQANDPTGSGQTPNRVESEEQSQKQQPGQPDSNGQEKGKGKGQKIR